MAGAQLDPGQGIKRPHKSVARSLSYSLTLGDELGWSSFTAVALLRLDDGERAALLFAALQATNPNHIQLTLEAALGCSGASMPIAPLLSHMDEAAFWADMAVPEELDAYCLASFNRMSPARKAAFLSHLQGRQAA